MTLSTSHAQQEKGVEKFEKFEKCEKFKDGLRWRYKKNIYLTIFLHHLRWECYSHKNTLQYSYFWKL